METDSEEQENPLANIPKMLLPKDKLLHVSYPVYKPSLFAELLAEGNTRTLFGEAVEVEFSDTSIPRLSELCKNIVAKEFKSGTMDPRLTSVDLNYIGEHLDVDLPLVDIVALENDAFWKRVFMAKCKDLTVKCSRLDDVTTDFKKEAIQLKLTEVIETTTHEFWNEVEMFRLAEAVASYVDYLHISQMTPMKERSIERDERLLKFKIHNYPEGNCHHGSLEMLGHLANLTKLELELHPPLLNYDYHRRYFLFSDDDIENLAMGLKRLTALNHLTIKRSRLDDKKMEILVEGLLHLPLKSVGFPFCELCDNAGPYIGQLLRNVHTIRSLELEGNYLGKDGLEPIAYAIRSYPGLLEYYGLARNPIRDDGVYILGSSFLECVQVTELNLNLIEVTPVGAKRVVELLEFHGKLRKVQICLLPLGEDGGKRFVEFMKGNKLLVDLEVRGCDLTVKQEYKIRVMLGRNKYFYENPVLMEEITSKELEDELNVWIKRVKHPVMLKVNDLVKKRAECLKTRKSTTKFKQEDMKPFFIHKQDTVHKTNSELFGMNYLERIDLDFETINPMPEWVNSKLDRRKNPGQFDFEPNEFSEKDTIRYMRFG